MTVVTFRYLNYKGEESDRTIADPVLEYHSHPGFGYQPGWFISGYDASRDARRSFALTHIILPETAIAHGRSIVTKLVSL
jgi:hypothetical protein